MWGLFGYYPGTWTVESLWFETPYDLAIHFYNRIPDLEYHRHVHTATTNRRIDQFMLSLGGSKSELPELLDYLMPFAQPTTAAGEYYSVSIMRGVRLAFRLGVIGTSHCEEMGWPKLKRSGLHREGN